MLSKIAIESQFKPNLKFKWGCDHVATDNTDFEGIEEYCLQEERKVIEMKPHSNVNFGKVKAIDI
jgi:hypothetical protein